MPKLALDLSYIRSLPGDTPSLPASCWYVLSDYVFKEIASTSRRRKSADLVKVVNFIRTNVDRVLVAKFWQDISREETKPGYATPAYETIEWAITRELPALEDRSDRELVEIMEANSSDVADHMEAQADFVSMMKFRTDCLRASSSWNGSIVEAMARCRLSQAEYIRAPNAIAAWLPNHPNEEYRTDSWRRALCVYPDEHAMGRWLRIMEWYSMQYLLGRTSGFANNYEDANYVFTASYCDGLVTRDRGMSECLCAVFPSVKVASDPSSFLQSNDATALSVSLVGIA